MNAKRIYTRMLSLMRENARAMRERKQGSGPAWENFIQLARQYDYYAAAALETEGMSSRTIEHFMDLYTR